VDGGLSVLAEGARLGEVIQFATKPHRHEENCFRLKRLAFLAISAMFHPA
jgi:hypothetical protein